MTYKVTNVDSALKENRPEIKKPDRVPFITTYNPALPNIHKVLHQKQPILSDDHQIFATYWFARNFRTQEPPLNPTILLALSAAAPNMDVLLANTLIMKEQTTHLTTLGKCEKLNRKLHANLRT